VLTGLFLVRGMNEAHSVAGQLRYQYKCKGKCESVPLHHELSLNGAGRVVLILNEIARNVPSTNQEPG